MQEWQEDADGEETAPSQPLATPTTALAGKSTKPVSFSMEAEVTGNMAEVEELVTARLAEQGFGILTRADLQAAFRNKIGKESPPRVILGACNPKLAYEILGAVPAAALMLPCNVVVESLGDDKALVRFTDALAMFGKFPELQESKVARAVAGRAHELLTKAMEACRGANAKKKVATEAGAEAGAEGEGGKIAE